MQQALSGVGSVQEVWFREVSDIYKQTRAQADGDHSVRSLHHVKNKLQHQDYLEMWTDSPPPGLLMLL